MQQKIAKKATFWLGVMAVGLIVGVSIQFSYAWDPPGSTPPAGNVKAPLTSGAGLQTKTGSLILNTEGNAAGLTVNKNLIVNDGAVGIGTTIPHPAVKLHIQGDAAVTGGMLFASGGVVIGKDSSDASPDPCGGFGTSSVNYPNGSEYQMIAAGCNNLNLDLRSYNHINLYTNNSNSNNNNPILHLDKDGWVKFGSLSSDPVTVTNGAMFYNTATGTLRCGQGVWKDCVSTTTLPTDNVTGTGANGRVAFYNGAYTLSSNANFFWDNASGALGIGTGTPTSIIHTIASGAKTASFIGNNFTNIATSSTASITKTGLAVSSTGTWNGSSAVNRGLYVNATGGTTNYAAIFEGGNVGIGTTAPSYNLSFGSANPTIGIEKAGTVDAGKMLLVKAGDSGDGNLPHPDLSGGELRLSAGGSIGSGASNMTFYTAPAGATGTARRNPTEKMRIGGDGNVGIGTDSPGHKLTVNGPIDYDNQKLCYFAEFIVPGDNTAILSTAIPIPQSWTVANCARFAQDACSDENKTNSNCRFQLACIGNNGEHTWTDSYQASTYSSGATFNGAWYTGGGFSTPNFCNWNTGSAPSTVKTVVSWKYVDCSGSGVAARAEGRKYSDDTYEVKVSSSYPRFGCSTTYVSGSSASCDNNGPTAATSTATANSAGLTVNETSGLNSCTESVGW